MQNTELDSREDQSLSAKVKTLAPITRSKFRFRDHVVVINDYVVVIIFYSLNSRSNVHNPTYFNNTKRPFRNNFKVASRDLKAYRAPKRDKV